MYWSGGHRSNNWKFTFSKGVCIIYLTNWSIVLLEKKIITFSRYVSKWIYDSINQWNVYGLIIKDNPAMPTASKYQYKPTKKVLEVTLFTHLLYIIYIYRNQFFWHWYKTDEWTDSRLYSLNILFSRSHFLKTVCLSAILDFLYVTCVLDDKEVITSVHT